MLAFRDREERPCDFVVEVVRREVELLGSRIAEMCRLRGTLETSWSARTSCKDGGRKVLPINPPIAVARM